MNSEKYFTLVLSRAFSGSRAPKGNLFNDLVKAAREESEDKEPSKPSNEEPPEDGKKELTRTEGKPPRSVFEIIKSVGNDGATFNEIIKIYAQASGQKPRRVNRTTIRYSLDRMVQSGKIKAYNRSDGQTVYVAGGAKDAKSSE